VAAGADAGEFLSRIPAEEGGVIVEGELELTVAGKTWLLGVATVTFDSRLPHRLPQPGTRNPA
jgi:hypothetical protein